MNPTTQNRIISGVLALGFIAAGVYLITTGEAAAGSLLIVAGSTTAGLPRVNEAAK